MRRADLRLLSEPGFRRLWLARTISLLGSALSPVALAFGVLDLPGAGPKDLAYVLTAQTATTLATVLFGGVLGDRFPRTRMLMLGEGLAGVSVGATAALFLTGRATTGLLVPLGALAGAGAGVLAPILGGLVPETVTRDRLQSANALLTFSRATVQIGGAALAGVLVATVRPEADGFVGIGGLAAGTYDVHVDGANLRRKVVVKAHQTVSWGTLMAKDSKFSRSGTSGMTRPRR